MTLALLKVACPQCGSQDVIYSCKPECCFNHVCNHCYTTFELATTRVGEMHDDLGSPPEIDPAGPTAPCARCGESTVFAVVDSDVPTGQLHCTACKAALTLHLTEIAPA